MTDFQHIHGEPSSADRIQFQARHGIIGKSLEMKEIVDTIMQVAPTDITVLVTGESGTGKEVLAKAIHRASKRSSGKFIAVNCGAIPEGLLENELFGHEKGSFTGATDTRKGYFEIADGGSILLDEIGDTPVPTQVKLLRVLETGAFMRVGSSEPRKVSVRIIAATNKDLENEVVSHRFRQDLYFRLRSINIRIPPLRSRRSDIPSLIQTFLDELRTKDPDNEILLTDDAIAALMGHSWPGNVRELKNVIESLFVLERGRVVDRASVSRYIHPGISPDGNRALPVRLGKSAEDAERELIFRALYEIRSELVDLKHAIERLALQPPLSLPPAGESDSGPVVEIDNLSLEDMEKIMIERVLDRFDGNRRLAAAELKISERTLYRKIREFGLS